ncbi:hypothetical protein [Oceaniglobus ichthyenteri]|uniref:hypothetical protein n=1 Tax=Oceaniglobus ichthyenteri TaxID=2136177 RepID=UPI000F81C280|nr:hypothetical protein [Oceaniglobus ichthyenteri]
MFMLRLCFYILRSALVATSIVVTGWFLAVSPTPGERRLLSVNATTDPMRLREAVVELRLARAAMAVAPEWAVSWIHWQGKGTVSRDQVEQGLRDIASGQRTERATDTAPPAPPPRQAGGAKFLTAPQG